MSVLALEGVSGGYGEADILHGVTLAVEAGEIVVVIGPNGAGKSTAIKAVFGLLRLSSGRIRLAGRDITGMATARVVREGVAYVPQVANVFPSLSVEENLEMGGFTRTGDLGPRIAEIYAMFPDLAAKRRQAAGTLSGGQRQMVAMGKALMIAPRILLLDEPTAGLSPKYQAEILETVRAINAAGTPVLMVEQNARAALAIADRGYVLVDGRNRVDGTGAGLLADPSVAQMFLGG
ncbi:MAG: ABC transporter ATP-binding protein [Paracoccaceae bacterium]